MYGNIATDLADALVLIFPQIEAWVWQTRIQALLLNISETEKQAKETLQLARRNEVDVLHSWVQSVKENRHILDINVVYERAAQIAQRCRTTVTNFAIARENIQMLPELLTASLSQASNCVIPSAADDEHNTPQGGEVDRLIMDFCQALDLKAEIQTEGIPHPHIVISW